MTGNVAGRYGAQVRRSRGADRFRELAASVEAAAGRRVHQAGYLARDAADAVARRWQAVDQLAGIGVRRAVSLDC